MRSAFWLNPLLCYEAFEPKGPPTCRCTSGASVILVPTNADQVTGVQA